MNTRTSIIFAFALAFGYAPTSLRAQELVNVAEDSAGNYHGGWHSGSNGGYGFGPWQLLAKHGDGESYAGFFVAEKRNQPDLQNITRHLAFGLYANGIEFEEAVAFRPFAEALRPGDAFSVLMEHGRIQSQRESSAPAAGSIGLTLRSGNANDATRDYNTGARFEFVYIEGEETYRVIDGGSEGKRNTGIPITDTGIELTFVLAGPDHYDLQVKILETDEVHEWTDRRLGGEGTPIESVALFNRDGEPRDLYFDGPQVNRAESAAR